MSANWIVLLVIIVVVFAGLFFLSSRASSQAPVGDKLGVSPRLRDVAVPGGGGAVYGGGGAGGVLGLGEVYG